MTEKQFGNEEQWQEKSNVTTSCRASGQDTKSLIFVELLVAKSLTVAYIHSRECISSLLAAKEHDLRTREIRNTAQPPTAEIEMEVELGIAVKNMMATRVARARRASPINSV